MLTSLRSRGLTLIELVVVLAIIGFALVSVLPSIADWTRDMAIRNAAESIKAGVEKARVEALKRNASFGFWLVKDDKATLTAGCAESASGPSWVVSALNPAGKCDTAPSLSVSPKIVEVWSAGVDARGVTLKTQDAKGAESSHAQFTSLGQLVASDEQIRQIDVEHVGGGRALRILIEPGGTVRMCDPKAVGADPRRCP